MSGGSHEYISFKVENDACGRMVFPIMERLTKDFVHLLHECEWAVSGDTCIDTYKREVKKVLRKWGIRWKKGDFDVPRCEDCVHATLDERSSWESECDVPEREGGTCDDGYASGCPHFRKLPKGRRPRTRNILHGHPWDDMDGHTGGKEQ